MEQIKKSLVYKSSTNVCFDGILQVLLQRKASIHSKDPISGTLTGLLNKKSLAIEINCMKLDSNHTDVKLTYRHDLVPWMKRTTNINASRIDIEEEMEEILDELTKLLGGSDKLGLEIKAKFDCLVPDQPLSLYEIFSVGVTTGGTTRTSYRPAKVIVKTDELIINARTDITAGASEVSLATLPTNELKEAHLSTISITNQIQSFLMRSFIVWIVFTLVVFSSTFIMLNSSQKTFVLDSITLLAGLSILLGLVLTLLFSVLPNLFKLDKRLTQLSFIKTDGKTASLVLKTGQKNSALEGLRSSGLKVIDKSYK